MQNSLEQTPISVLDLASYPQGGTLAEAFANTRSLALAAERHGYCRYWLAEHHNAEGVGSAATAVLIGHVAGGTRTIRVGSGGVMLPNHSPYVIAEQFGTLATLYPGRIDLGLGRAPGTDPMTARAIRGPAAVVPDFARLVKELVGYFAPAVPGQALRAIPGAGVDVPIWILGSSLYSAELAASLGRPYAFAGHFAPAAMIEAFELYRSLFRPSAALDGPRTMAGVGVVAAETDGRAEFLATSVYQRFLSLVRGDRKPIPPPVRRMTDLWTPAEAAAVSGMTAAMIVGGPDTVRAGLQRVLDLTGADELIVAGDAFAFEDRLESYEIVADVAGLGKKVDRAQRPLARHPAGMVG